MWLFSLFSPAALHAGPGDSASYHIAAEATDAGGKRTSSTSYTNDSSIGDVAGLSAAAAPAETMKHGYIGQLYDVTALQLAAEPVTLDEGGTRQLSAAQWLDDLTLIPVSADAIQWSILNGPLTGISAGGLATAGPVYQDTAATALGSYAGLTGSLELTIVNSLPDNFGTYAGDHIADDWQVQYFGLSNPLAGPHLDPDGDTFDNLFEYHARLVPTDASSFLSLIITDAPGGGHAVVFSPRLPGTTYTLLGTSDLSLWAPVGGAITDAGTIRSVLDQAGTGQRRFYRLEVERE